MKTVDIYTTLLEGNELSAKEFDAILASQVNEDEFLEFKHGDVLKSKKDASVLLRKYVSGFANSEGGLLIIGVDEKELKVTGCKAPGGGDLSEWAARCITPLTNYLSPLPRFYVLNHNNGDVLIAIVGRSLNFVPVEEHGERIYYFRLHEQTIKAPEFLISDLLLGKKALPNLTIVKSEMLDVSSYISQYREKTFGEWYKNLKFDLVFTVENQSLIWAEDVKIGLIGQVVDGSNENQISQNLLTYIQIEKTDLDDNPQKVGLLHRGASYMQGIELSPFSSLNLRIDNIKLPFIRPISKRYNYIWNSAIFLLSKNSIPVWYQLSLKIDDELPVGEFNKKLSIKKVIGSKPIISIANAK